jgi:hypothetical protein
MKQRHAATAKRTGLCSGGRTSGRGRTAGASCPACCARGPAAARPPGRGAPPPWPGCGRPGRRRRPLPPPGDGRACARKRGSTQLVATPKNRPGAAESEQGRRAELVDGHAGKVLRRLAGDPATAGGGSQAMQHFLVVSQPSKQQKTQETDPFGSRAPPTAPVQEVGHDLGRPRRARQPRHRGRADGGKAVAGAGALGGGGNQLAAHSVAHKAAALLLIQLRQFAAEGGRVVRGSTGRFLAMRQRASSSTGGGWVGGS